jgi:hypothetical protein
MSIAEALKALHVSGELTPWIPARTRKTPRRRLYLTKEALSDLRDPNSAINLLAWNKQATRGRIEASLDLWVLGNRVYLNRKRRFMCRLEPPPPEIWEVRVTEPQPQVRLFGSFVEPDTLIITKFHSRHQLGNRGSRAWTTAMSDCARKWTQLLPMTSPLSANAVHSYITENCDDYGPDCSPAKGTSSRRVRSRKNKK